MLAFFGLHSDLLFSPPLQLWVSFELLVEVEKELIVMSLLPNNLSLHVVHPPSSPANGSYAEQDLGSQSECQDRLVKACVGLELSGIFIYLLKLRASYLSVLMYRAIHLL